MEKTDNFDILDTKSENPTKELVETQIAKTKQYINNVLEITRGGIVNNILLTVMVKNMLSCDGWEIQPSANPGSKGKKIKHEEYGIFASGNVDQNLDYIVDSTGIPANFTLLLKGGGNLVRMNGGQVRFTNSFKK